MNTLLHIYSLLRNGAFLLASITLIAAATSCSTGIESTKKITMNKQDVKLMAKTDEQIFAAGIKGTPLSQWTQGKKFLAMGQRTMYLFDPASTNIDANATLTGRILTYSGRESAMTPDLKEECVILFSDGSHTYKYHTGKTLQDALNSIDSSKLPLLVDMDLADEWKQKLTGKTLWTKNNLWYDESGRRKDGLKFVAVKVEDVQAATGDFPLKLKIRHGDDISYVWMNSTSEKTDSRNFAALFFLKDPKSRYPQISDENWLLIQSGRVGHGMTKEECRLALGNPDELRAGHSTSQSMDIWQYSNGTYLFFTDGLLTSFRQ